MASANCSLRFRKELHNPRLQSDIQIAGRFIGNEQLRLERQLAWAIMALCRNPPLSGWGYSFAIRSGFSDANCPQQLLNLILTFSSAKARMIL